MLHLNLRVRLNMQIITPNCSQNPKANCALIISLSRLYHLQLLRKLDPLFYTLMPQTQCYTITIPIAHFATVFFIFGNLNLKPVCVTVCSIRLYDY